MTNKHHQGSFLNGFAIGLFAGAAGFFLFGTDDGKKTCRRIAKEWTSAKSKLAEQGVISNSNTSLRSVFASIFDSVAPSKRTNKRSSKKVAKKATSRNPRQKFKGT